MKKIIILSCMLFLICSCGKEETPTVQKVDCASMEEMVNNGAILIDVRTSEEFKLGHLDSAANMDVENIATLLPETIEDKDVNIILYCKSGTRSAKAANTLIELGYKNVYDLGAMDKCA